MAGAEDFLAVVLTGTIGAGKTTVAERASEILHAAGLRHGLIEFDWLAQIYPPPDEDDRFNMGLAFHNLRLIVPTFVSAGASRLLVSATIESRTQLDEARAALRPYDVTVALITASPAVVAERIRQREHGALLEDFLARTDALAITIAGADVADFEIKNDGEVTDAAEELLARLDWKRTKG